MIPGADARGLRGLPRRHLQAPQGEAGAHRGRAPAQAPKRDAAALALISLAALAAAWLSGVRFLDDDLQTAWTLLDPDLLRTDLFRSLVYLHAQPPLLNLVVGLALKIGHAPVLLTVLWSACAMTAAQCTRSLALELGATRWPALAAGALVAIAPSTLLYAHHVGPEMAAAAVLVASALLIARGRHWSGFVLLGVACLLRSLLAPPVLLIALLAEGRRAWKPGLTVFTLLIALAAKNALVAGVFSTSSWVGMNFARVTAMRLPPWARPVPPPFAADIAVEGNTGVPALDQFRKSGGGVNYNNLAYARASNRMVRASLGALVTNPRAVAAGWAEAWLLFFTPADGWYFLFPNRARIETWASMWDGLLSLRIPLPCLLLGQTELYLTMLLGIPLVFWLSLRDRRAWYALSLIGCVALLGNTLELGENYRFRFLAGPLLSALAGTALSRKTRLAPQFMWPLQSRGARQGKVSNALTPR
jgi:hypothetical protein